MQAEYDYERLTDEIPIANVINFNQWVTLRQYGNITKGVSGFIDEELDELAVFYDSDMKFIDYIERRKVEDIVPAFVLLPRFFWENHIDSLPLDFIPGMKVKERLQILNYNAGDYWTNLQNRALTEEDILHCDATPREEQKPALDFLMEHIQKNHKIRGIFQAAPGFGKTASSIILASQLRAKTLVIVPNTVLQDQWVEAIVDFTDLTEDDIGIIQGSDIQDIEKEIQDKAICVVKIQSLYSQIKHNHIASLQQMYRHIDLILYDEVHGSGGANNYSKTSSIFLTGNILGLTATPYRTKINEYMLRTSIGDVIYKAEHQNLVPDIEIHNVWTEFTEKENTRLNSMRGDYVMMLGVFNSLMRTKYAYFEYLADVVAWNVSNDYNVVVLFPTIIMQELLLTNIERRHPGIVHEVLLLKGKTKQDSLEMVKEERKIIMQDYKEYKETLDVRVKSKEIKRKEATELGKERRKSIDERIGFLKEHALDLYKRKIKEAGVIVSNYNLLSAGFDKPEMSNIIFGGAPRIGKISVIQSIGRITRIHEGKKQPLVQYFVPSKFMELQKSTGIILQKNIRVQYPDAKFKYIGFQDKQ